MSEKKGIAILGSTGNLGQMALDLLRKFPDVYRVEVLVAQSNKDLLVQQALEFKPNVVVIEQEEYREQVDELLWEEDIKTYAGSDAVFQVTEMNEVSTVVNAISGLGGVKPTMMSAKSGKNIILGNTDSLHSNSEELLQEMIKRGIKLLPASPLHSGVLQLLRGEEQSQIEKLIIHSAYTENEQKEMALLFDISPKKITTNNSSSSVKIEIEFTDGTIKSISNITEIQALAYALFYPLRVKV